MSLNTGILTDARQAGERVPHREECKLMHGLIEGYIVNNGTLTPYRYSYFEKSCRKNMCTRQSRKVTWDMINIPSWHCSCRTYFLSLSFSTHKHTAISKKVVGENGERRINVERKWTTERNCGYAIWYAKFHTYKLRSSCVKMINTPTMNVCLRVLDSEEKRISRFLFQWKDVPRFLVWMAYCFRLYIASNRKFRNIALNCSFRNSPKKWSLWNWMLKNMDKPGI